MTLTTVPEGAAIAPRPSARGVRAVIADIVRRPLAIFGLVVIVVIVAAAVLAPNSRPTPEAQFFDGLTLEGAPLPPNGHSGSAPTCSGGTFSRACSTAREPRCLIGVVANGVAVTIGMLIGVTAGYLPRLGRHRTHALHRPDDGVSGAAPRHRAGGDLPSEPVDRGAGHRAGELGAGRAHHLHRDAALAEREFIEAERSIGAGRGASSYATSCRISCRPAGLGHLGIATTVLLEATL